MITRYRRKRKYLFIVLMLCVLTMSIGFSAFSSELVIASSASVKPDSSAFRVIFSSSGTQVLTDKITGTATGNAKAGSATIENGGDTPKISDLTATFTGPGETVKYEFYVYNSGAYVAYLRDIVFKNVDGESSSKVCTAIDSSSVNATLMQNACNDINVSIDVGSTTSVLGTTNNIRGRSLGKGVYEKVVVTITYTNNENRSDGDFKVEFGDIGLTYSTVDSPNLITFYVGEIAYQAIYGMSWKEFVDSQYNTGNFSYRLDDEYVLQYGAPVCNPADVLSYSDIISVDTPYYVCP